MSEPAPGEAAQPTARGGSAVLAVFTSHWLAMVGLGLVLTAIVTWACLVPAQLRGGEEPAHRARLDGRRRGADPRRRNRAARPLPRTQASRAAGGVVGRCREVGLAPLLRLPRGDDAREPRDRLAGDAARRAHDGDEAVLRLVPRDDPRVARVQPGPHASICASIATSATARSDSSRARSRARSSSGPSSRTRSPSRSWGRSRRG